MEKTNLTFISKWLLIIYKKLTLYIFIKYMYLLFPVMFSCSKISITIFYIHLYVYLFVCVCVCIHSSLPCMHMEIRGQCKGVGFLFPSYEFLSHLTDHHLRIIEPTTAIRLYHPRWSQVNIT